MTVLTSTVGLDRSAWLEARRVGIGGSDAAKIVLSAEQYKYADPGALYLDKIGEGPAEEDESLAARHGRFCEELVAQLYEEATGNKVRRCNMILRSDAHPFMIADIDRKIVGRREGLECKTVGEFAARMKETDPETGEAKWVDRFVEGDMETSLSRKPEWYCQMQHYMAVTGWEMWHLAVLIGNRLFLWYDVPRDDAWIDEMIRQEAEFWKHVERRENIWEA
jgi:putative phage-type endonuclease